jgi:hypothetical protein
MGHIGTCALERIAESKALARASARRAEKQAHRRIAGELRVSDSRESTYSLLLCQAASAEGCGLAMDASWSRSR